MSKPCAVRWEAFDMWVYRTYEPNKDYSDYRCLELLCVYDPEQEKEIEELSSENIRLQNLVKDLSDWNDKLKERLSYREAYPDNFLKEPEQEPVAIVSGYYGGQCVILPVDPARIFNSNTALYTSPPAQRKPLTDEEIDRALDAAKVPELPGGYESVELEIARAIEAAHGIKEKNT